MITRKLTRWDSGHDSGLVLYHLIRSHYINSNFWYISTVSAVRSAPLLMSCHSPKQANLTHPLQCKGHNAKLGDLESRCPMSEPEVPQSP